MLRSLLHITNFLKSFLTKISVVQIFSIVFFIAKISVIKVIYHFLPNHWIVSNSAYTSVGSWKTFNGHEVWESRLNQFLIYTKQQGVINSTYSINSDIKKHNMEK